MISTIHDNMATFTSCCLLLKLYVFFSSWSIPTINVQENKFPPEDTKLARQHFISGPWKLLTTDHFKSYQLRLGLLILPFDWYPLMGNPNTPAGRPTGDQLVNQKFWKAAALESLESWPSAPGPSGTIRLLPIQLFLSTLLQRPGTESL